jgi:hypothetical protein
MEGMHPEHGGTFKPEHFGKRGSGFTDEKT